MSSLLLLLALKQSLSGAPLASCSSLPDVVQFQELASRSDFLLDDSRTIWDIVWACFATIFACTWVAVHPNIPSPRANPISRLKSRLMVMVYAWIAPECVTMWAMRQRVSAQRLVQMYNESRGIPEDTRGYLRSFLDALNPFRIDKECESSLPQTPTYTYIQQAARLQRWTLTHGFFTQMGGYMVFRGADPHWTLFLENIDLERDMNLIPYHTEEELMDRSKGDVLSKGVAMLQTVWFGFQCFTRVYYGLPLTELETVTLAFATLNIVTYMLWWHKPLNVQYPIRVCEPLLAAGGGAPIRSSHNTEVSSTSDTRIQPTSSTTTLSDTIDNTEDSWEELLEVPWFLHDECDTALHSSQNLGTTTLTLRPGLSSSYEEIEQRLEGAIVVERVATPEVDVDVPVHEEDWNLNELPWYPSSEVLGSPRVLDAPKMSERRPPLRMSLTDLPPCRWQYTLPWSWAYLPRRIALVTDGGWYTIHLRFDEVNDATKGDGPSSCLPHNNRLEMNIFVPQILRSQPWVAQMCIILPFWCPYIFLMVLYTFIPYRFFVYLFGPLASMAGTSQAARGAFMDTQYPLQVPMFFTGPPITLDFQSRSRIWYATFFLTSIFGAIHSLGWYCNFPTTTERTLWRSSTLIICGVPPTVVLWVMYRRRSFPELPFPSQAASSARFRRFLLPFANRVARVGMPMYICARAVVITLAFLSLRDQPEETYKNPPWTSVIPHL